MLLILNRDRMDKIERKKMNIYSNFASVYDRMQYDVNYALWTQKLVDLTLSLKPDARHFLELATGTATLAIGLAKKGYFVEAVDISEEMLTVAQAKAYDAGVKIKFFHQDMTSFNTKKKYDCIFSLCDGFNYLVEDEDLESALNHIYTHLKEDGILIFDVSSRYKLKEVIGNHTFAETFETEAYIWENDYDDHLDILEFTLTLFKKEKGSYQRYEEFHTQRAHTVEKIMEITKAKFDCIDVLDGDTFDVLNDQSHRICFVMKKKLNG